MVASSAASASASTLITRESDAQSVMNSLRQIVHALETGSRAAQKSVGLSGAQLLVLQILETAGAMSINELAQKSHTHQSSVSVVASRLVEAGLIRRASASEDARRLQLSVTTAGRKALQAGFVTPQQRLMGSLGQIPRRRVRQLRVLLEELVGVSGMDSGTAPMFFEERERKAAGRPTMARTKPKPAKK
ncbi:MAG: MarR family winged helix-turn-helix transcriptional regulator [Bryobacteraceae bacterium]